MALSDNTGESNMKQQVQVTIELLKNSIKIRSKYWFDKNQSNDNDQTIHVFTVEAQMSQKSAATSFSQRNVPRYNVETLNIW